MPARRDSERGDERGLGAGRQSIRGVRCAVEYDRTCRVGYIAVLHGGDVELHNVTGGEPPRARNTMDDLVVDADQHGAGEAVSEGRR